MLCLKKILLLDLYNYYLFAILLFFGTFSLSASSSVFAQNISAFAPPAPTVRCTANWYRWQTTRRQFNTSNNAVNPTAHSFTRSATNLGANAWYRPTRNRLAQQIGISSLAEPAENNGNIGEIFYGIKRFELEANTLTVLPIFDPSLFEGHVFASFDSSGNQLSRYPTIAQNNNGIQYISSFNNGGGRRNQTNDLRRNASWSDNGFVVNVPPDGIVFVHYIVIDETTQSRAAFQYCPQDFSDAPASYGLARHNYDLNLKIGAVKDVDRINFSNATATGDDNNGDGDSDEDGVSSITAINTSSSNYSVTSAVLNDGSVNANLHGWIDFDRNGTFDADEYATVVVPAGTDTNVTLNWSSLPDITAGNSFVRLRLTTSNFTGADAITTANDGEVEDYALSIMPSADLAIFKTNTPGVNGNSDQVNDTVISGNTVVYTITITNNGPDSITGAVVTDNPISGLTCAGSNPLTLSGDGVPTGNFTIADLTSSGISLDRLDNGQSTILTYSCLVN